MVYISLLLGRDLYLYQQILINLSKYLSILFVNHNLRFSSFPLSSYYSQNEIDEHEHGGRNRARKKNDEHGHGLTDDDDEKKVEYGHELTDYDDEKKDERGHGSTNDDEEEEDEFEYDSIREELE